MSLLKAIWDNIVGSGKIDEPSYESEFTGFGVRFHSSLHGECLRGSATQLIQMQYVILKMMVESGDAEENRFGFFIPGLGATRLGPEERHSLELPPPWPGRFELEVNGHTQSPAFALDLCLIRPDQRRTKHFSLVGPLLKLSDAEFYLPNAAQIHALVTVEKHRALGPDDRKESANLSAIYALQQAQQEGLSIELRQFDNLAIDHPESIAVTTVEQADGSLRLIPNFGPSLNPEEIERCLGQLEQSGASSLRVGKRIVILDEARLKGASEILSNRRIPAKERDQFLKTPGAFIDASLIDLDNGFSIRVHGAEAFQKAYFGESDGQSQSWYGDPDREPDVLLLNDAQAILSSRKELEELHRAIVKANVSKTKSIQFKGKTILLPQSKEEQDRILGRFDEVVADPEEKDPSMTHPDGGDGGCPEPVTKITVKIDLNDDILADNLLTLSPSGLPTYNGPVCQNCLFSPFAYQEEGIRWLAGLANAALTFPEQQRFGGGLLADDMGLGKTFMTLVGLQLFSVALAKKDKPKPFLVIAPLALLENWQAEVEKVFSQSPFLDLVILQTGADLQRFKQEGTSRETQAPGGQLDCLESAIRYSLKVGRNFGNLRLDMPNRLVLTNYDTLRDYQFSLCSVDWGMVIFDEAQEIKNPNTIKSRAARGLKADFRLAVTGTPVENSLTDFWALFDTVNPGLLGSYQQFRKQYIRPIVSSHRQHEDRQRIGQQLRGNVGDLMLRRTKEEQLDGLPLKLIHDGEGYSSTMRGLQLQRYNSVVTSVAEVMRSGDATRIRQIILPGLRRLRDISLHPDLLDGGAPPVPADIDSARELLCQSEKLRILMDILEEVKSRNEKVIIFAINKRLQLFLSTCLVRIFQTAIDIVNGETKAITSRTGRGVESRKQIIDRFQTTPGFGIIIMSPLAAGVGLTVVGANNVIHLERHWNPAKEAQATDRVYRIGANKDVHVYIPILKHPTLKSFDCNLQELLSRKIDLKDAVVTPTEARPEDFNAEDVFGGNRPITKYERITKEWLQGMSWSNFEALAAILGEREYLGISRLTEINDCGADAVVIGESKNALIQCKTSRTLFKDPKAVREPCSAKVAYELGLGKYFVDLILCTNVEVSSAVRKAAKTHGVKIWACKDISQMLDRHEVVYSEIEQKLDLERISIL